jgi:hypothetical protein
VTDIHHETLDKGEHKRSEQKSRQLLPKKCPKCTYLRPPKVVECPVCGFIPVPQPGAHHKRGELIELTSRDTAKPITSEEQVEFLRELLGIAGERGYKPGWAAYKFKEKFGTWPPRGAVGSLEPRDASPTTRSWVKSRTIAYAKAMQKAQQEGVSA